MQDRLSCIRTDLAIESAEVFENENDPWNGICIEEFFHEDTDIKVTTVKVENESGAEKLHKPQGTYITIESPQLPKWSEGYHEEISKELYKQLDSLIPDIRKKKLLVVGIGNKEITPDALGPLVVEHLFITRHLIKEDGVDSEVTKGMGITSAIAPGVMAQTGMEAVEIIKGVVDETQPEVVIAVDALAARNIQRLNSTIQVTDTGISPGAGVGNQRNAINEKSLGIPVIAIGIPTVIDAATIVNDTMNTLMNVLEENSPYKEAYEATKGFDEQEKYQLMRELMEPQMANMFVTPKDIDETMNRISYTLSEAINRLCHNI